MVQKSSFATPLALILLQQIVFSFQPNTLNTLSPIQSRSALSLSLKNKSNDEVLSRSCSRRDLLQVPPLLVLIGSVGMNSCFPQVAAAASKVNDSSDGNLPELPIDASRSYLQYRFALQVAADYYVFELMDKIGALDEWGEVNQLFETKNGRSGGLPNRIERDYTNPMRIIGLAMPPDESDELRASQFKFERAMAKISKAVKGVRRDLPVEIDKSLVTDAKRGWEDGRVALNDYFSVLNTVTGLNEMQLIPNAGANQIKLYGRSPKRYFELAKKTKLCQNRGGPALSQAWGQLMVSGYLQDNFDSCGIPDPVEYFYQ